VDRAARLLADPEKDCEKAEAVFVVDEAAGAVVSPLEHVEYVTGEHYTGRTWHAAKVRHDALDRVIESLHVPATFKESDPFVPRSLTLLRQGV
jgi:hypothetical protein